ncbi:hypothetical protein BZA70DRAFT_81344 [Myxozyma melibiosi]|uniref:NADH dehydrogenase [ubiquinone] iron-sulfur protein 5 n=1 Tax=Myxozyma melibiosi TaxID=54550 RepID=A0ABR1EZY2_9ASCO
MSSGFGMKGGVGRCYNNFTDLIQCYKDTRAGLIAGTECSLPRGDYMECIHHTKEKARLNEIREEVLNQKKKKGESTRLPRRGLVSLGDL